MSKPEAGIRERCEAKFVQTCRMYSGEAAVIWEEFVSSELAAARNTEPKKCAICDCDLVAPATSYVDERCLEDLEKRASARNVVEGEKNGMGNADSRDSHRVGDSVGDRPATVEARNVAPSAMCWHKEIDHETGICKTCGAKAAIKLEGLPEDRKSVDMRSVQDSAASEEKTGNVAPSDLYPKPCGLCDGQVESRDDTEWHGLGNCVPACERCMGSGIDPKDELKVTESEEKELTELSRRTKFVQSAANPVPAAPSHLHEFIWLPGPPQKYACKNCGQLCGETDEICTAKPGNVAPSETSILQHMLKIGQKIDAMIHSAYASARTQSGDDLMELEQWLDEYVESLRAAKPPVAPTATTSAPTPEYPKPCGLCDGQVESRDDTEWHGLGNCVPACERCMGSGIDPKDELKVTESEEKELVELSKRTKFVQSSSNLVPVAPTAEQLEKLAAKWEWAAGAGQPTSGEVNAQQTGWMQCAAELRALLAGKQAEARDPLS